MKYVEIINNETGEIIKDWSAKVKGLKYVNPDIHTVMNVKGIEFDSSNIGVYSEEEINKKSKAEDVHPIFGPYVSLKNNKKYSKVFQLSDPEFTHGIYYKYWLEILLHLAKDTNVIYKREPKLQVCNSKEELRKLVNGGHTTFYEFYKEATSKRCIAQFKIDNKQKFFVINPVYALNGNRMPIVLVELFMDPLAPEREAQKEAKKNS